MDILKEIQEHINYNSDYSSWAIGLIEEGKKYTDNTVRPNYKKWHINDKFAIKKIIDDWKLAVMACLVSKLSTS